jgi:hypothetical protein
MSRMAFQPPFSTSPRSNKYRWPVLHAALEALRGPLQAAAQAPMQFRAGRGGGRGAREKGRTRASTEAAAPSVKVIRAGAARWVPPGWAPPGWHGRRHQAPSAQGGP